MSPRLPPSASVAHDTGDGRLHAPSAARNAGVIADLLEHAMKGRPASGALEIASGTGQHVVTNAARLPHLTWQPTELDPDRIASIDAHVRLAGLANVRPARMLDATRPGWSADVTPQDLILLANLLHLIPMAAVTTLIEEAGHALAHGGTLILYGPFMRSGTLTSDGDRRFHAELTGADPTIGYKSDTDIARLIAESGMIVEERVEMPANNLAFLARRS
ncbi:methyltransferase [Primorskyibacter flagellatus]|uniref:Methyltransferase n=1 Tax=Primorskyibacter flagellatus TaxID=1387277 RepID=A0A917ADC3_9RHOB|nr:DUF938 domain-containing protein [Primorskyibacter flagellatus]GGE40105.1 methyltransferase [Primorskyibacter flagellatus]